MNEEIIIIEIPYFSAAISEDITFTFYAQNATFRLTLVYDFSKYAGRSLLSAFQTIEIYARPNGHTLYILCLIQHNITFNKCTLSFHSLMVNSTYWLNETEKEWLLRMGSELLVFVSVRKCSRHATDVPKSMSTIT